jgi:hypothetical protein
MTYSPALAHPNTVHPRGPIIRATHRSERKRKMPSPKKFRQTLKGSDKNLTGEMSITSRQFQTTPLPGSELPPLSREQAKEVSQLRASEREADTQAATETPSQPTPSYLRALAISEATKARMRAKRALNKKLRNDS